MSEAPTYPGDGAWKNPVQYYEGMDPPKDSHDKARIDFAKTGIKKELRRQEFIQPLRPNEQETSIFGPLTTIGIRTLQRQWGFADTGRIGKQEAFALWLPLMFWWQTALRIPDFLLIGQIGGESAFDPGAEGRQNPQDRGLGQLSRKWRPHVTDATAYGDPAWVIQDVAAQLAAQFKIMYQLSSGNKFTSEEAHVKFAWNCAVAFHNRPEEAKSCARAGLLNTHLTKYVAGIRRIAAAPI